MGKLFDHSNCPNPVQWGSSPVKTVYIRDTESGKPTWKPVGWICTGCGVFRSKSGWFPSGKADPICDPWRPAKTPVESILESPAEEEEEIGAPGFEKDLPTEDEIDRAEAAVMAEEQSRDFAHSLEAHIDYGGPGKPLTLPEDPGLSRVTIPRLQRALGISRAEVIAKVEAGEIPVEKDKYRHWAVPYAWLEGVRHAEV